MAQPRLPSVYNLISFDVVGSTNDEARRLAEQGEDVAPDGTIVWALEQTAGRGRRGRTWASPPGNLYTSLVLRPDVPVNNAAQLSFVAALALFDALGTLSEPGHQLHLKWPNDLLLQEKKVAGLLLESESSPDGDLVWVIVGMGLNVGWHPEDVEFPATSLRFEQWSTTVEQALEAYCRSFLGWANRWVEEGFEPVRRTWLHRCIGKGKEIEVRLADESLIGILEDMDETGALVLNQNGELRRIAAGDVYLPGG